MLNKRNMYVNIIRIFLAESSCVISVAVDLGNGFHVCAQFDSFHVFIPAVDFECDLCLVATFPH